MQVLAKFGYEFKKTRGLNYINGEVIKIKTNKLKLPHIGWNKIKVVKKLSILENLDNKDFYFVHSFILMLRIIKMWPLQQNIIILFHQ